MFNWTKWRKSTGKFSHRKVHRQDHPRQSSFRPRLELLEKRELLYAGALDQSFGVHGIVLDSTFPYPRGGAVGLQTDGKILVAGTTYSPTTRYDFVLERFNSDGSPDTSFGSAGTVRTDLVSGSNDEANCIAIQSDGRILVAGSSQLAGATYVSSAIVRYNADGTLDTTFDGGMVFNNFADVGGAGDAEIKSIALQPDGEIVAAGDFFRRLTTRDREFALARYNPDGTLDTTFGTQFSIGPFTIGTGEVLTDFSFSSGTHDAGANSVAIQSDGRIVAAGFALGTSGFALARY